MPSTPIKRFLASAWETAEVVIIALVTVFIIRSFIAQPFLVSGASMEPTFQNGNYLLIDELTYRFREPERGEVIIFRYPGDEKEFFIKRVIGLPHETLTIADNQITITTVSGEVITLAEPYLTESTRTFGEKTVVIEDGEYFVMGDNRSNSFDSRSWGTLKKKEIVGVARLRLFPFSQIGALHAPEYK
jgi:signal peptidase I